MHGGRRWVELRRTSSHRGGCLQARSPPPLRSSRLGHHRRALVEGAAPLLTLVRLFVVLIRRHRRGLRTPRLLAALVLPLGVWGVQPRGLLVGWSAAWVRHHLLPIGSMHLVMQAAPPSAVPRLLPPLGDGGVVLVCPCDRAFVGD